MEFERVELGEIARFINGRAYKNVEFKEHGTPIVRIQNLNGGGKTVYSNLALHPDKYIDKYDLIYAWSATFGPYIWKGPKSIYHYHIWKIEPNSKTDKYYLYYLLKLISDRISSQGTGSIFAHITKSFMESYEVDVLSYPRQKQVSKVLKNLDDKIELNQQINQNLEQMAQAIFKSWFVDFDPVKAKMAALEAGGSQEDATLAAMQAISGKDQAQLSQLQAENLEQYNELRTTAELFPSAMQDSELGEIPEGWEVGKLSDLIDFNPKRVLKKGTIAPYLDMKNVPTRGHLADEVVKREMNSGTKFINGDTLLARITPCLENGKTAFVDFLDNGQVGWGSTEYIVMRSRQGIPESLSYFIARDRVFRQFAIQSMTGTSGRQRANAKAIAELPWLEYPRILLDAFNKLAMPYLKIARTHGDEIKLLSEIRDTLLPKLLSGELNIYGA